MPREGVSYEAVVEAAEALKAAGVRPHVRAVREYLGGTGSPNTIHRHLARWTTEHPESTVPEPSLELLTALREELARQVGSARSQAEAQFRDELTELTTLRDSSEARIHELEDTLEPLRRAHDELRGVTTAQATELEQLREALPRVQEALTERTGLLDRERELTVQLRQECAAAVEREGASHSETDTLRERLHEEHCARVAAERELAAFLELKDLLRRQSEAAQAREQALQEELKTLRARTDTLAAETLRLTEQLSRTASELKLATQLRAQCESRLDTLSAELTQAQKALDTVRAARPAGDVPGASSSEEPSKRSAHE